MTKRSVLIKSGDRFIHVVLNEVFLGISMITETLFIFYKDLGEKIWIPHWQHWIVLILCYFIVSLLMIDLVKQVNWVYRNK
jgi:hypothetical protein